MSFSTQWYRVLGATDDETKAAAKAFVSSRRDILDPLRAHWVRELNVLLTREEAMANYESPAHAAKQADFIGQRRILRTLIEMLTFDQEEIA